MSIGKKVQDAEQIGTEMIAGKEVPICSASCTFLPIDII